MAAATTRCGIQGARLLVKHGAAALQLRLTNDAQELLFVLGSLDRHVGDLCRDIRNERPDFDSVQFYASDNVRIAHCTPVNFLFKQQFLISINDTKALVSMPADLPGHLCHVDEFQNNRTTSAEGITCGQIDKQLSRVNEQLNVLKKSFEPLEQELDEITNEAAKGTKRILWLGLGCLAAQGGAMARLTWWEYSWDVVEPLSYFLGHCGVMIGYSYFLLTHQPYSYATMKNRSMSFRVLKTLQRKNFDVANYETLKRNIEVLQNEADRLLRLKALGDAA